jgi:broad specificity phosphatase PhoE
MNIRLLLISHASTAAMRAARFPADDPLDAHGIAEAETGRARLPLSEKAVLLASPAACARETASVLGFDATVETALADLDYGRWRGQRLAKLAAEAPQALAAWTSDPDAVGHGGESFSQLVERIANWLDAPDGVMRRTETEQAANGEPIAPSAEAAGAAESQESVYETKHRSSQRLHTIVAVTHASVIRAAIIHALGASPAVFSRIEIAPMSIVELRRSSRGWTWWPSGH